MKNFVYYSCAALLILLIACKKDFVAVNITGKSVTVNGPANNLETTFSSVTFWWDLLDGADKYSLQIVRPSFANVTQLVIDTNITKNKFTVTLQPGSYQWRIKAVNAGYATDYQIYTLKIDTTSNLSQQLITLLNPTSGLLTGKKVVTFKWSALNGANNYELQINGGALKDTIVPGTSVTYTLPAVSNATTAYTWNVKGIGSYNQTQYNTVPFTFTVDLKAPSAPGLSLPASASSVRDTVSLVWVRNGSDAVIDSIYVADDSLFTNLIVQQATDQTKLKINALSPNLNVSPTNSYYFWRVRSFDQVGNRSSYSNRFKFKLIP